jgi:hypothetical protein
MLDSWGPHDMSSRALIVPSYTMRRMSSSPRRRKIKKRTKAPRDWSQKKRVHCNMDANVTMFYNNDPRSTKMGLAKWSSTKRKDLSRCTPTDKGLPMPGRSCSIHFRTDPEAKKNTSKLDANVTMFYNNDTRTIKMGLAKWSSQRNNLSRWGDDTAETTEPSESIPCLPRRSEAGTGV